METLSNPPATDAPIRRPSPWSVFRSASFRKLWAALTLSLVGDLFNYIAMAWLVLQITRSPLTLGVVLTVQAVPRSLLMLVGGAIADRLTPRVSLAGSMALRFLCVAPLAILVLGGEVQLWEVYVVAALFGAFDAFFYPSAASLLPRVVASEMLEPANAVRNITQMASIVVFPGLAGLLVAAVGTGWAFAVDAFALALGTAVVLWIPAIAPAARAAGPERQRGGGLLAEIGAGLKYAWADPVIRFALLMIAAVDFAANGAVNVGLPTLAHNRFSAGATGLGVMLGAWGVGAAVGAAVAGLRKRPDRMGLLIIGSCAWIGAGLAIVGLLPALIPAAITLAVAGISTGLINTYGMSWLQRRTNPEMQGRVMALVMLASVGLVPISLAASGAIAQANPTILFLIAGAVILLASAVAASNRTVRQL
ncbi:MAG TPA: MFS transporter [Candidatus Dormibacteraeota bacterium]|nr:MFS transporter [Candidatus Dormibacteraeota bacterium]